MVKSQSDKHLTGSHSHIVSIVTSTTYTNSGVLSSTVLNGMKLEILEPLHWLML